MNLPLWLSNKLSNNASRSHTGRVGIVVAIISVALSVAIMLLTISIVVGFKDGITKKVLGFDSEISILPAYNPLTGISEDTLSISPVILDAIKNNCPDAIVSKATTTSTILKTDTAFAGIMLVGRQKPYDFNFEKSNIISGTVPDYDSKEHDNDLIVSQTTANALGVKTGDSLFAYFIVSGKVKARKAIIAGIYASNFDRYDETIAFASPTLCNTINNYPPDAATVVEVRNIDLPDIEPTAQNIQNYFIDQYQHGYDVPLYPVDNVKNTGGIYFSWLSLLDTNVVVIFILMLLVSGFTLVAGLFIIILKNINAIGILRSMGAPKSLVRNTFQYMALRVVGKGMIFGNIIGLGIIAIQYFWQPLSLDPAVYYLNAVPVDINWLYIILVNIGTIIVAWLILILPSFLASSVRPAQTLRFE